MKLSSITIVKNFIYLFIFTSVFASCEPDEIPMNKKNDTLIIKKIGGTGDQEAAPIPIPDPTKS